jgi:calmodulin
MCVYQMNQKDTSESKIRDCLSVLDKEGNGYVSLRELRHLVSKFGEALSDKELEAFMENFTVLPNNTIRVDDIVDLLRFEPNAYLED